MRLKRLYANRDSFKTINFNNSGLSIITSRRISSDKTKTYNSVGKSLSIRLIHFCLGSNESENFISILSNWEFYLETSIENNDYRISRNVNNPKKIKVNDKEYSVDKFCKMFGKEVFFIQDDSKYISFRGLISRFIRPTKYSYNNYKKFILKEDKNNITENLNNEYLLGLDINLSLQKVKSKSIITDTDNKYKNVKKDDILKSILNPDDKSESDITSQITQIETEINQLNIFIQEYKIAEDMSSVKDEADKISQTLKDKRKELSKAKNNIININKSLTLKSDIKLDTLLKYYEKARITFGLEFRKSLKQLEEFNHKLLDDRVNRLRKELSKNESRATKLQREIKSFQEKENDLLKLLNNEGALEDYSNIHIHKSNYEKQLDKLKQYIQLFKAYEKIKDKELLILKEEIIKTKEYLETISNHTKLVIQYFQSFVKAILGSRRAGIEIKCNESDTDNQRFQINANIQGDSGDAINEVKIFSFDWTLLKLQKNHKVKFIFHDSRITGDMDPRQVTNMIKTAYEESEKNDFQYIISLNENTLLDIEKELNDDEMFKTILSDNIVLELFDDSPEKKLLGINVDLISEAN